MKAKHRIHAQTAPDPVYRQIWRVVDGAVKSAFDAHPGFLAPTAKKRTVRNSIVKRVVGAVHSHAEQSARVRSGCSPADDTGAVRLLAASEDGADTSSSTEPQTFRLGGQEGDVGSPGLTDERQRREVVTACSS